MAEEDSVLGNLPRSRPGKRSEKRGAGKSAGPRARPKRTQPTRAKRRQPEDPPRAQPGAGGDPLTGAVRAATKLAGTGARVAGTVANEFLRRLPRP
jgi:hypothetical protein